MSLQVYLGLNVVTYFAQCSITGAVVASPTFSLPEYIGGIRNWYFIQLMSFLFRF